MQAVLAEIAIERLRQVHVEKFSAKHDDVHTDGALATAAAAYAWIASLAPVERREVCGRFAKRQRGTATVNRLWPRNWSDQWFKPKSRRHDLIRAAALIVAEIERLDRAAAREAA